MSDKKIFKAVGEKEVTRAIVKEFSDQLQEYAECEVIIVGGGPSGLLAAKDLASAGHKVLIVERNNYLGGGFWIGGYLMNKVTVRSPADEILEELAIPYKEVSPGLLVADGPHACSKLIAAACDAGAKIANMTIFEDAVLKEHNRVAGAVINWTSIRTLPKEIACVDPVALESKVVIDASGHDAVVCKRLEDRGIFSLKGFGAMWIERSEDLVVEHTSQVCPGLVITGMAVSTFYGLPRMGPTFGSMLLSGRKGAEIVKDILR